MTVASHSPGPVSYASAARNHHNPTETRPPSLAVAEVAAMARQGKGDGGSHRERYAFAHALPAIQPPSPVPAANGSLSLSPAGASHRRP